MTRNPQRKSTILFARVLKIPRNSINIRIFLFSSSPSSVLAPTVDSTEKLCWALFSFNREKNEKQIMKKHFIFETTRKTAKQSKYTFCVRFFLLWSLKSYNNIIYKTAIKLRTRERNIKKPVFVFPSPTESRYKFISLKRANSEVEKRNRNENECYKNLMGKDRARRAIDSRIKAHSESFQQNIQILMAERRDGT